jgi:hypothetical protein
VEEALRYQLISERRFPKAIELQQERLAADPGKAMLHHQMAWLQAAVRNVESALVHELIASALSPDDPRYKEATVKYRAACQGNEGKQRGATVTSPEHRNQGTHDESQQVAQPVVEKTHDAPRDDEHQGNFRA